MRFVQQALPINRTLVMAYQRIQPPSASAPSRRSQDSDPQTGNRQRDRVTLSSESIALWEASIRVGSTISSDEESS